MTEWDPQVRSRVNRPYPSYPFLILHSHIGQHFVFFMNVRSNAPNFNFIYQCQVAHFIQLYIHVNYIM
jgi:hypothetical protein